MDCKQIKRDIHQNWIIIAMLLIRALTPTGLSAFQVVDRTDNGSNGGTVRTSVNIHYVLNIQKMKGTITLDGVIDEEDWLLADVADDFLW